MVGAVAAPAAPMREAASEAQRHAGLLETPHPIRKSYSRSADLSSAEVVDASLREMW
jgi:hypothetical protein